MAIWVTDVKIFLYYLEKRFPIHIYEYIIQFISDVVMGITTDKKTKMYENGLGYHILVDEFNEIKPQEHWLSKDLFKCEKLDYNYYIRIYDNSHKFYNYFTQTDIKPAKSFD